MSETNGDPETDHQRDPSRPSRGTSGRRVTDYDARTTLTKRVIVVIVVVVDALYLAGEALLAGQSYCP
jgi:hypothetical protein